MRPITKEADLKVQDKALEQDQVPELVRERVCRDLELNLYKIRTRYRLKTKAKSSSFRLKPKNSKVPKQVKVQTQTHKALKKVFLRQEVL